MNNSTLVEAYFDHPNNKNLNSLLTTGFTCLNTIADLLANQHTPLEPRQCEAVGQLLKEVNMLTFLAYERTMKH